MKAQASSCCGSYIRLISAFVEHIQITKGVRYQHNVSSYRHPSATAVTGVVFAECVVISSQFFHVMPYIYWGTGMDYMRVHLVRCFV